MTAAVAIAPWHTGFPGRIAGSVYAVAPARRADAARDLARAGLDVHVDVMAADEGLPAGIDADGLGTIAAAVDRARLGVHLIGSPDFVDAALPGVLAHRPAKVFLPWAAFTAESAQTVRDVGSSAWIAVWDEWDGIGTPAWPTAPDGALVMLIEPGTAGPCRLGRLGIAAACAADLPVDVDGGVTEVIAPLCITAGVESMVIGRALLAPVERSGT